MHFLTLNMHWIEKTLKKKVHMLYNKGIATRSNKIVLKMTETSIISKLRQFRFIKQYSLDYTKVYNL